MKNIYRIAALAAAVALTSCTIDIIGPDGPDTRIDGARTIAVSFAPSTKSKLNGVQPEFKAGDKIMVSNGKKTQTCTVNYDHNGGASFTTELEGDLTAVYPTTAANLKGPEIIGILVPQEQTGKFEDANIAKANIKEGAPTAVFQNQTAILSFYVDASIGVNSIEILSEGIPIADNNGLNVYIKNGAPLDQITDDPAKRLCYAAVLPGKFKQLTVTSYTKTQAEVKRVFNNVSLPANTLANVFIPYYIPVNVSKDSKPEYQYWAYCNLGAFLPEETGYYFTWGNIQGYVAKYDESTENVELFLPSGRPALAGGFTEDNYDQTTGSELTGSITAENDAATAAWGGKWRMPTKSEFDALCALNPSWGSYREGPQYGCFAGDIFFPAVGSGRENSNEYMNKKGSYWSSTLSKDDPEYAEYLKFSDDYFETEDFYRYHGRSIRPIYGDPLPEGNGLEVNKYNEGENL